MYKWPLHEAKNKLSHLVDAAEHEKPQCITRRGKEAVVIISMAQYRKLLGKKIELNKFLLSGPKSDDFEIERVYGEVRGEV